MSAFIRRQPVLNADLGTRPGLHGQVLISSGLAGVDRLLGGGLPLGCILLILEDNSSSQHINLLKCFMAEGVCCKQTVGWITTQQLTPEATAAFLPAQAKASSSSSSSKDGSNQVRLIELVELTTCPQWCVCKQNIH